MKATRKTSPKLRVASPEDRAASVLSRCARALRELPADLPLKSRLDYWHKAFALITGAISLSYSGTGISRATLAEWRDLARAAADDVDKVASRGRKDG